MRFRAPTDLESPKLGQIAAQTFGFPLPAYDVFVERVGRENLRVAVVDEKVVGGLAAYRLSQWFGGRSVPTAGVALVCVPPENRSTGLARFMMTSLIGELHETGTPLATLFASTQQPYRRVGFEQAGTWNLYELPMSRIGRHTSSLPIHPVELHSKEFESIASARALNSNGNLTRTGGIWDRLFAPRNESLPMLGYIAGDGKSPEGYIVFEQIMQPSIEDRYLQVRDMAALTGSAYESLWSFLHSHRSIFPKLRWYGAPLDPFMSVTREAGAVPIFNERWMTRIVDVTQALSLRGYPKLVEGILNLSISDDLIESNRGRFRLEVKDGQGQVTAGGNGDLKIDVGNLSPLYTSLFNATTLASLGKLSGSAHAIELADLIFAGPQPWMPDKF